MILKAQLSSQSFGVYPRDSRGRAKVFNIFSIFLVCIYICIEKYSFE